MKTSIALSPTASEFAPLLFAGDLRRGMEVAAQLGFDGVELNLRDSNDLDQEEILIWARELGLALVSFGTGQGFLRDHLSLADTNPRARDATIKRLQGHIDFASRAGAAVVLGGIRGRLPDSTAVQRSKEYVVALETTRALAQYAAERRVRLLVEPINRYETNFLNTVADVLDFIEQVKADNVGLLADTFHMNIEERSLTDPLRAAGGRLWHVHLADNNRCAPGMGCSDLLAVMRTIRALNFGGYISAEILPRPDDETASRAWMRGSQSLMVRADSP